MIGRLSYEEPWFFHNIDSLYFGGLDTVSNRKTLLEVYAEACEDIMTCINTRANKSIMIKPIINLFKNQKGSNSFRSQLDRLAKDKSISFSETISKTIELMETVNPEALNS